MCIWIHYIFYAAIWWHSSLTMELSLKQLHRVYVPFYEILQYQSGSIIIVMYHHHNKCIPYLMCYSFAFSSLFFCCCLLCTMIIRLRSVQNLRVGPLASVIYLFAALECISIMERVINNITWLKFYDLIWQAYQKDLSTKK